MLGERSFLYPDAKIRGLELHFSGLSTGCLGLQNVNTLVEVGQLGDSRLGALGEWENEEYRAEFKSVSSRVLVHAPCSFTCGPLVWMAIHSCCTSFITERIVMVFRLLGFSG